MQEFVVRHVAERSAVRVKRHSASLRGSLQTTRVKTLPDRTGHFGPYGGMFVPETLVAPLQELTREYERARRDKKFRQEFEYYLREYAGRPTPLYFAERMTHELAGPKIYLKREDLRAGKLARHALGEIQGRR